MLTFKAKMKTNTAVSSAFYQCFCFQQELQA